MHHGVLVDALKRMWCDDSFYLLCESEGHEFWDTEVDTASKGDAEVNA